MKRLARAGIPLILAVLSAMALFPTMAFAAATPEGFVYTAYADHVEITGYTGGGGEVVIPSAIEGKDVTTLGSYAFSGVNAPNAGAITTLTIPNKVTSISVNTFDGCTGLKNVHFQEGLAAIGISWFDGNSSIENVYLPESLTSIGQWAFLNCTGITGLTIPKNMANISGDAFDGCTGLKTVNFQDGLAAIGSYWFSDNSSIENVYLPESLTSIGQCAFLNCTGLSGLTIPKNLVSISGDAFDGCTSLDDVSFQDGLTAIGNYWFEGNSSITDVVIPEGVLSIGSAAFKGCGLEYVILPDPLQVIGEQAFYNCDGLSAISIPSKVTSLAGNAFLECDNLQDVSFSEGLQTVGQYWFSNYTTIQNVYMTDSVTRIGQYAFSGCTALSEITLSAGLAVLEGSAFGNCANLSKAVFKGAIPDMPSDPFAGTPAGFKVHYDIDEHSWEAYSLHGKQPYCIIGVHMMDGSPEFEEMADIDAAGHIELPFGPGTRPGYDFGGWYKEEALQTPWDFTNDVITSGIDIYAKWELWVCSVFFNPQGGSVNPASKTLTYNQPYGELPVPRKTYCRCEGWYTQADGAGEKITAESIFTSSTDQTLYAYWVPASFVVTFDAQGGTVDPPFITAGGDFPYEHLPVPLKTGYDFNGWFTQPNGAGSLVTNDTIAPILTEQTLYAKWTEKPPAPQPPADIPVGIACRKTDASLYGAANGSITITATGGNSGAYQYSIDGGAVWQASGFFGNVAAGTYTAQARDANNTGNNALASVTVSQPKLAWTGTANKMPSKANAGTAWVIRPAAAPKGYTLKSIAYASGNKKIAYADAKGNATFLKGGKVKITVTAVFQKGKATKTVKTIKQVTVNQLISSITLNKASAALKLNKTLKLIPKFYPASATNKKVKWKSSNTKVATVSGTGVVSAKKKGTAVISCTAQDKSKATASCTVTVN